MADGKTTPARALAAAAEAAARRAEALFDAGRPETLELAVRMLEAATRALAQAGPLPIEPAPRSGPVRLPPARSAKERGPKEQNVVVGRLLDTLVVAGLVPPKIAALLGKKFRIRTPQTHDAGGGWGFQGSALGGGMGTFGGLGGGGSGVPGGDGDGGTGTDGTGGSGTGTDGAGGTGTGTEGTGGSGTDPGTGGTEASGPGTDGGAANDPDDPGRYVVAVSISADGEIDLIAGEEVVVGEAVEGVGAAIGGAIIGLVTLILAVLTVPSDEAVPKPTAEECKQIKEQCLDHCSGTALPTGNFGARFNKCMRECMEDAGCYYNPPAW